MLDSGFFSHPEICSGDQSNISLLATIFCNLTWIASKQRLGRKADSQASEPASLARYSERPPWRATSRLTVDATRSKRLAISRIDEPEASPREISSRSRSVSARSERRRTAGTNPPYRDTRQRMEECSLPKARPISCIDCLSPHGLPDKSSARTPLFQLARSIKGRVKRKNNPGDWKEQKRSPRSPAQVMLRGSGVFALRRSILFS